MRRINIKKEKELFKLKYTRTNGYKIGMNKCRFEISEILMIRGGGSETASQ